MFIRVIKGMVIYSKGGHRKMLRHVSFKNWNPIGKTYGHKNHMLDSMENKSVNTENVLEKEKLDKKANPFGEAATLELSRDYVRTKATRTLKLGTSGDDVKKLQENLNALGYNTGTPDGKFGNNTKNAVILFQKVYGLDADGMAGSATQNAINTAINRKNKNILAKGQISNDVKNLQNDLKTLGFLAGSVDGKFGAGTEAAVKAFQQKYGLTADGLVGNTTKAKLAEVKAGNQTKPVNPTPSVNGSYTAIKNGNIMQVPKPGDVIDVSLGTDLPTRKAKVSKANSWSIEYSIKGCRKKYPDKLCTKRLNSALEKYSYNAGQNDLLQLDVPEVGKCYAGAMIEGFGNIGDIAEITLDDGSKFNFMLLDTKSKHHTSAELSANSTTATPQCQNDWGHGYMLNNDTVQLSICEFIVSQSNGAGSAKAYPSGSFLNNRYVTSAKIIGHADI